MRNVFNIVGGYFVASRVLCVIALFACVITGTGYAQITTPLHIGATIPMVDEFNHNLLGHYYNPGDVVQILWASNGIAYPPAIDGTPHPDNALLEGGLTGVGALVIPSLIDSGLFGASIAYPRPGNGSKIFVRVFNDSDLKNASFYGDSYIFTVNDNEVFDVGVVATTNPLDAVDSDYDGLNNSWEKSYVSNPENPDTDGDGVTDLNEVLAGTDLLDAGSAFALSSLERSGGADLLVGWSSVPDHTYQVQFTTNSPDDNLSYQNVSSVITATDTNATAVIADGLLLGKGYFRVVHR